MEKGRTSVGETEMRMLRWIFGVLLRDRKRSEDIRREVLSIRCVKPGHLGNAELRKENNSTKRIMEAEVNGKRSTGRQKKR